MLTPELEKDIRQTIADIIIDSPDTITDFIMMKHENIDSSDLYDIVDEFCSKLAKEINK